MQISDYFFKSILISKKAPIIWRNDRTPMSTVVIATHDIPLFDYVFSECFVTEYMFCHSMCDLDNSFYMGCIFRQPCIATKGNISFSVKVKSKSLHFESSSLEK